MELTLTGGFIILLGLVFSLTAQVRLMQSLVFFASFSGTAVVNFGDYGMAPDVVLLGFLLLTSVLSGRIFQTVRLGTDHLIAVLLLLVFVAITLVSLVLNSGVNGLEPIQFTQTSYLLFGVCVTLTLSVEFSRPDRLEAGLRALRAAAVFISLWGLFQAACYYTGLTYPAFLFNNSTSHFADMYDQRATEGVIRIASVATEPSFMAISLMIFGAFGATAVLLDPLLRVRAWLIPVFLTLATVALSTSSTGYFGLAVLLLLVARRRPSVALASCALAGIVVAVCISALPEAREALYNMTLGKLSQGSYLERSTTFGPALELFYRQPWLGFGWGADFSYSIATLMLANVGILGSAAFCCAAAGALLASHAARKRFAAKSPRLAVYAEAAENAFLVYLAESAVSGFKYVVADFWCLWAFLIAIASCLSCHGEDFQRGRTPAQIVGVAGPQAVSAQRK